MKRMLIYSPLIILAVVFLASCTHDPAPPPPSTAIHLDSNQQVGKHLVDKDGRSLYYFSNDADGLSNCTGGCLTTWPIYYTDSASTTYSSELSATDFKTITTAGGTKQTTYKGWPLYYYAPGGTAEAAGQTTGEGVGGVWFVAKTNYSIMVANFQLTGANGTNYLADYTPGTGRTSYLVDGNGNTLYAFGRDSAFINKFTKPDFSNDPIWPMYQTDNVTVPSTLDKSLFVPITFNGRKQLTYKGWPLYYYGPDNNVRGSNKGITIPPSQPVGSVWPVVKKDAPPAPRL
jgi:predicted lipoprotein with Yx(FWY)xxD motif